MAVAFGTATSGVGTGTSFSVNKPASTASGDMLYAVQYADLGSAAALTLTGGATWTTLTSGGNGTTTPYYKVYYKEAGGSEPATYTAGQNSSADGHVSIIRATGAATTAPVFDVSTGLSGTSISTPSITPEGSADLLIRSVGAVPDGFAVAWTQPASHTEQTDQQSNTFTTGSTATRILASGAATGTASFTASTSVDVAVGITLGVTAAGADPQTVTPTGIATGEAFGTAQLNLSIAPMGIASGEVFGTAQLNLSVTPTGIATGEAFGGPDLTKQAILPTGIPTGVAVGTPTILFDQTVTPTGIASGEQFGAASLQLGYPQTIEVGEGIASGERVPSPGVGLVHEIVLRPPSIQETPAGMNGLHVRYGVHRGISIIKRGDGTYVQTRYPALTDLEEAQAYWLGGYRHVLSVEDSEGLTGAGYGAYITLEEVT